MRRSYALLTPVLKTLYPNSEARLEMSVVTKLQQWGRARQRALANLNSAGRYLRLLEIDLDCVGRRAIRRQGKWRGIVDRLKRQLVEPGIAARLLDKHIAKCSARANFKRHRRAAALDSFGFVARQRRPHSFAIGARAWRLDGILGR